MLFHQIETLAFAHVMFSIYLHNIYIYLHSNIACASIPIAHLDIARFQVGSSINKFLSIYKKKQTIRHSYVKRIFFLCFRSRTFSRASKLKPKATQNWDFWWLLSNVRTYIKVFLKSPY